MRNMKDSGIEWIGDIPETWKVIKVKNLYTNNKYIVGNKVNDYERLALTLKGVIKRSKDDSDGLQPQKFEGYQVLKENELVFKLIDLENINTSRVGLSPYTGIVSPAYIVLNNKNESRFGYYYFLSMWHREIFNKLGGSGVRSNLNSNDLLNLPYLCINHEDQELIADYLDDKVKEIDNIISKTQETIEEYKKYKQSVIREAVTKGLNPNVEMKDSGIEWIGEIPKHWNVLKMKYLGELDSAGVDKKIRDDEPLYKSIHYTNVYKGSLLEIGNSDDYLVVSSTKEKALRCMLKKGDVLFTNSSETPDDMGHSTVIKENLTDTLFGYHLMRFRPRVNFCLKYEKYLFGANYMRTWFEYCSNGITRFGINRDVFANALVLLPPLEEQQYIANYLDKKCNEINNLTAKKQELITQLENYKKSLIYECVTGKKAIGQIAYTY